MDSPNNLYLLQHVAFDPYNAWAKHLIDLKTIQKHE